LIPGKGNNGQAHRTLSTVTDWNIRVVEFADVWADKPRRVLVTLVFKPVVCCGENTALGFIHMPSVPVAPPFIREAVVSMIPIEDAAWYTVHMISSLKGTLLPAPAAVVPRVARLESEISPLDPYLTRRVTVSAELELHVP
jgi:hypothetical protein